MCNMTWAYLYHFNDKNNDNSWQIYNVFYSRRTGTRIGALYMLSLNNPAKYTHIFWRVMLKKLKSREVKWLAGVHIAYMWQRQCLSSDWSVFKPIFSPNCPLIKTAIAKNCNEHMCCLSTYIIDFLKGNKIPYSFFSFKFPIPCPVFGTW